MFGKRTATQPIVFFVVSCLIALCRPQRTCPPLYRRYSTDHTYCKGKGCTLKDYGVTNDEARLIVRTHNEYRSKVAMGKQSGLSPASDMLQMVWDKELAAIAQSHANQCKFQHDCNMCRQTRNFPVGQNLYQSWITESKKEPRDWPAAIKSWWEEVKDFNTGEIDSYHNAGHRGVVGHLTQMLWARTWRIGCGYSSFDKNGATYQLYTCNYGPAGNVIDAPIYTKGSACNACPLNSCCGGYNCQIKPYYNGLCKIKGRRGPKYQRKEKDTFFCDFSDYAKCHVQSPGGMKRWTISRTLSGAYAGIILKGGERSVLNFTNTFKGRNPSCFSISYRKGPNVAGEQGYNKASENFVDVKDGYNFEYDFEDDSAQFLDFGMNLNWDDNFKFSLAFEVPSNAADQYFEVTDVSFKEGEC